MMRTQEQIIAQLEARYKEIQDELEKPERKWPCKTCRHGGLTKCSEPLIRGVSEKEYHWDFLLSIPGWSKQDALRQPAGLCGPEKALWEPKPSLLNRILTLIGL